jgi:hypothetical protein
MKILHAKNYKKELGDTTLGYSTLLGKMNRYSKNVSETSERSLGIGDGYRQVTTFPKEDVLEVCQKVLLDLEKLANKDNYTRPWEILKEFLKGEQEAKDKDKETLQEKQAADTLPKEMKNILSGIIDEEAVLISANQEYIHILCRLESVSQAITEEVAENMDITLYIYKHIPFILLSYRSICFIADIPSFKNVTEYTPLLVCIVEGQSEKIIQRKVFGFDKEFVKKIKNVLDNSPYKTEESFLQVSGDIKQLIHKGEMVDLGKTISAKEIKE